MTSFGDAFAQAWQLIVSGDPYLGHVILVTLQVLAISTLVALLLGLPAGLALGIGRFRGRRALLAVANAGLGLPPVIVGLVLVMLFIPVGPLGGWRLLFTLPGVFVAQTILALPVVIAFTASAVAALAPGLLDQARALGASRGRVAWFALREARVGVVAAVIAAASSSLSEVGAVVLVGGNIEGVDQTLASAALQQVDAGRFVSGLAIGIVLLALIAIVSGALTALQVASGRSRREVRT